MLGMLVQCTKDSYAVLTVEVLCVLSCNVCAFVINIRQLNKTIRGEKKNYVRQEPITRSLHLHWFLESTFSRIDLQIERPDSREKGHISASLVCNREKNKGGRRRNQEKSSAVFFFTIRPFFWFYSRWDLAIMKLELITQAEQEAMG